MLLAYVLRHIVKTGALDLIDALGRRYRFGDAPGEAPVAVRFHGIGTEIAIAFNPRLALGEAYMNGRMTFERGTLFDFLDLVVRNIGVHGRIPLAGASRAFDRLTRLLHQINPVPAAERHVRHHYDLDGRLYDLFLDTDKQYSCAYFPDADTSLEQAQLAKKRHIAAKLRLKPGQQVLDIGCGWGGLALYLAENFDVSVLGITLSHEQHAVATRRAAERNLSDRVRFEIIDYRKLEGRFDRIVSVGMFEHVGAPHFSQYFQAIHRLLTEDGVALVHSIGRSDGPGVTPGFIRKYIFPGGYIPALSEVMPAVERSGLWTTDIEILRLHYAETLRHWRERFVAQWDKAKALYDERFCRMWEFYLAASEVTFRHWGHMVFQMQLARSIDALPLTRDYMFEGEMALKNGEKAQRPFAKSA